MNYNMESDIVYLPKCRTCKHIDMAHYPLMGKPNLPPLPCRERLCKCTEYLPTDNLEYLEYMHEKETSLP